MGESSFPTHRGIKEIIRYVSVLDRPASELFRWGGGQKQADGTIMMPYVDYSSEVSRFIGDLYRLGFVQPFPWGEWQDEASRLHLDSDLLGQADLTDIVKLFTVHVRRDRFVEGHFSNALEQGWILQVLRRLQDIDQELERSPAAARLIENREELGQDQVTTQGDD